MSNRRMSPEEVRGYAQRVFDASGGVVTVTLPTGSGKTTMLPPALCEAYGYGCKVLVSLPTRIAALSACSYVKRTTKLRVDYSMRGHRGSLSENDIIYATTGSALSVLYSLFSNGSPVVLHSNLIIVLDEIHVGSVDNTVMSCLWALYMKMTKGAGTVRPTLVLMSATTTGLKSLGVGGQVSISSEARKSNTTISYYPPGKKDVYVVMIEIISTLLKNTELKGNILSFVPGKSDCYRLQRMLSKSIGGEGARKDVRIYIAHGDMSNNDMEEIMGRSGNVIKVIFATNVAESSVTIPDVVVVVDSMLENVPGTTSSGGFSIEEKRITKNSSIQRMGRAARETGSRGVYYALISEEEYNQLEPNRKEEIYTRPIHRDIIVMFSNLLSPHELLTPVLDRTLKSSIDESISYLLKVGAIVENNDYIRKVFIVQELGKLAATNPQRVESSTLIFNWIKAHGASSLYELCLLSCIIDTDISRMISFRSEASNMAERTKGLKEAFADVLGDDSLSTILNIWNKINTESPLVEDHDENKFYQWCQAHSLNAKCIKDVMESMIVTRRVVERLTGEKISASVIDVTYTILQFRMLFSTIFSNGLMVRKDHRRQVYIRGKGSEEYTMSINIPYKTPDRRDHSVSGILAINTIEKITRTFSKGSVSLFINSVSVELNIYTSSMQAQRKVRELMPFSHLASIDALSSNRLGTLRGDIRMTRVSDVDMVIVPHFINREEGEGKLYQNVAKYSECLLLPILESNAQENRIELIVAEKEEEEEYIDYSMLRGLGDLSEGSSNFVPLHRRRPNTLVTIRQTAGYQPSPTIEQYIESLLSGQ